MYYWSTRYRIVCRQYKLIFQCSLQDKQAEVAKAEEVKRQALAKRKEEEAKLEAQVAALPDWKRPVALKKLKAKLDADFPDPYATEEPAPPTSPENGVVSIKIAKK